jgi:predicted glycosyltransferase
MKILIDINHPAHVHYFRNFYRIMTSQGHEILVVSRNKEIEHKLLSLYNIPYVSRGKGKTGKISKLLYLVYADFKLLVLSLKFKPDLFLNFLHPYPSHVAWLLGKPSLVFSDSEHAKLHHQLTVPFATKIFTPSCYLTDLGEKQVRFNGYMELSYLHPNYYKPDPSILNILGVKESEKFVIVRFVSWAATHDFGHKGMTLENKRKAVFELGKYAKVFISSEGKLPDDLEAFRIKIPFHKMHDALYYASLLFGESATMASESAILGTPSIFMFNEKLGYTQEEETQYHMVNNFTESPDDQEKAIQKGLEIIQEQNGKEKYRKLSRQIIADRIDTTAFMINEVLKYNPELATATAREAFSHK